MGSEFDYAPWLAAGLAAAVGLYLVWGQLLEIPGDTPPRSVEVERVELRAATVEGAVDHLVALSVSVFPRQRPELLALDRADYADLVRRAARSTSPLLPATAARVWIGPHLVAVVRVPNPNYAA